MDISLYYQEKGKGIPFVLLHGNGESGDYFKNQIDYFSKDFRMIAIDTRGHGKSPRGNAPFTMNQFVEDLSNLLKKLEVSKVILLGFSDGANIAMKFTIKYPEKVKALILNGGNLNTKGVKTTTQVFIELGYKITKMFSKKSEDAKRNMELLGLMVNEPNIKIEEIHSIQIPTLVIEGKNDMIKEKHTREIADNIPNADLSIIKGNHFIANKQPKAFNNEVEKFLIKTLKK
ncbi:MAG: alpha/beta fold hydrolase [Clostridia bacterium]